MSSPRPTPLAALLAAVLAAGAAAAAPSVDSLADAACVCADGALSLGDHVSCVVKFARRLEARGLITAEQRQEAVRTASEADLEALSEECDAGQPEGPRGRGVSLSEVTAFYPASFGSGPVYEAHAFLRLWNFTDDDVFQSVGTVPVDECSFLLTIRDGFERIVRRDMTACPALVSRLDMPIGTMEEREMWVPLATFQSETGLPDGTQLRPGVYRIELRWRSEGPQHGPGDVFEGGQPLAAITIRVGADP